MPNKIAVGCLVTLIALACINKSQAAFVVYDDFNGPAGPVDPVRWGNTYNAVTQSGGTVTINENGMRSLGTFPVGSTLRFIVNSISGSGSSAYLFGTNANAPPAGAATDAMYVRNDTGGSFYVDGASQGASPGSTGPATFDFVFGATTLEILRNNVAIASLARPVAFADPQRFEMAAYSNPGPSGQLVVDEVLYQLVPEPGSFAMLLLGSIGMLQIRKMRTR